MLSKITDDSGGCFSDDSKHTITLRCVKHAFRNHFSCSVFFYVFVNDWDFTARSGGGGEVAYYLACQKEKKYGLGALFTKL